MEKVSQMLTHGPLERLGFRDQVGQNTEVGCYGKA